MAVRSTMFLKSLQNLTLLGQAAKRSISSTVNQMVQTVSMTKNGSRKLGESPSLQCVIAKTGSVSTQNKTIDTRVMTTDTTAIAYADRDVSGYSRRIQICRRTSFRGRWISSVT